MTSVTNLPLLCLMKRIKRDVIEKKYNARAVYRLAQSSSADQQQQEHLFVGLIAL